MRKAYTFFIWVILFITGLNFQCNLCKDGLNPINEDILRQVFIIKSDTSTGTCFLINYKDQKYLITAKHVFRSILANGESIRIGILIENTSQIVHVKYFIHPDKNVDIAVLQILDSINVNSNYAIGGEIKLGQDVYFLGYPKFKDFVYNGNFPMVKKGILSGYFDAGSVTNFFIDGNNSKGFSGGPAVGYDYKNKKPMIFGIVTSYKYDRKEVINSENAGTSDYILENTGIINCFSMSIAINILQSIK